MSLYEGWDKPRPGWVCRECALDYDATPATDVGPILEAAVLQYRARLQVDATYLRKRPDPSTWSALEYACHVRDSLSLYDWRIRRVLSEQRPRLQPMRRDQVVLERGYNSQDPETVGNDMAANCGRLTNLLGTISETEWQRTGVREGEDLSVAWMAVNVAHEARHHLVDVDRALACGGV